MRLSLLQYSIQDNLRYDSRYANWRKHLPDDFDPLEEFSPNNLTCSHYTNSISERQRLSYLNFVYVHDDDLSIYGYSLTPHSWLKFTNKYPKWHTSNNYIIVDFVLMNGDDMVAQFILDSFANGSSRWRIDFEDFNMLNRIVTRIINRYERGEDIPNVVHSKYVFENKLHWKSNKIK